MSGIVGLLQLDGAPVDEAKLALLSEASRHRGPDGGNSIVEGCLGMAYRHLETGSRPVASQHPITFGGVAVILDGRIDNRNELRALLNSSDRVPAEMTDAELVALAFQKWGNDCANRLIGEFAFAVWDSREQRLFCARDALGVKPLHYYQDSSVFLFASEIRPLLEHPRVQPLPNEGMIAEYISFRFASRTETLYRNIYRLPPGHYLSLHRGQTLVRQYWEFPRHAKPAGKGDDQYAQEFLSLFSEAVRCRVTEPEQVGFDLSGGLDSSSIVSVANRLTGWGSRLQTFSLAFEGDAADEREYIGQVARFAGVTSNLVSPVDIRLDRAQQLAGRSRNFPGMPSLLMHDPVCEEMRSRSMRIHITGVGGDQWLMGNQLHTADLLRRLRLRSAIAQARFDSKVLTGNFSPFYLFARYGIAPLLPRSVIKIGKRFRTPHSMPTWIEPAFARKTALFDRLNVRPIRPKGATLAQNGVWATANSAWLGLVLEMVDEHGFSFGLERRHPFLDRRLVEFCIGLPEEQRWRQDELKFVLRTAMKGIIPEGIRVRRTKGDFTAVAAKYLLRPDVRAAVESSTMANLGWVNRAGISRMYAQMAADYERGADFSRFVIPLSMICGVELWLQHAQFGSLVRRFEPVS